MEFLLSWGSQPIGGRSTEITVNTSLAVTFCSNRRSRLWEIKLDLGIWESFIKATAFELGLKGFQQTDRFGMVPLYKVGNENTKSLGPRKIKNGKALEVRGLGIVGPYCDLNKSTAWC